MANCSANIHLCVSVPCQLVGSRVKAEMVHIGDRLHAGIPEHYKVMVVVHRFEPKRGAARLGLNGKSLTHTDAYSYLTP